MPASQPSRANPRSNPWRFGWSWVFLLALCSGAVGGTALAQSAAGRLINLSILTSLNSPGDTFTLGYVVGGTGTNGTKSLVIRAAGPSLGALGVAGVIEDPRMELFAGPTKAGENDNWGGAVTLASAMTAVGAFAYTGPTSLDAAVAMAVAKGDNSVAVSGVGAGTGQVIAEIYDATPTSSFFVTTPRLLNVSVLKPLGTGLTMGFVVGGNTPLPVLVRAVGPTLGTVFGVAGAVSDPQLTIYSGQAIIGSNDNWGGTETLRAAFAAAGAFALPDASRDAAAVVMLPPGNYTVVVSGVAEVTGTALVEVYELPGPPAPAGFVLVPAGTFTMGDTLEDGEAYERPTRAVAVSDFFLARTEVTWAEWREVRDWAVSRGYPDLAGVGNGKSDTHPVYDVAWYDVVKWLNARSEKDGLSPVYYTDNAQTVLYRSGTVNVTADQVKWGANGYRLPTEAEWEKAARGGSAGQRFPWGNTIAHAQANYYSDVFYRYDEGPTRGFQPTFATGLRPFTAPAESFSANGFGLFGLAGNVREWCWDWIGPYSGNSDPRGGFQASDRVARGGSWISYAFQCRSAYRGFHAPLSRQFDLGFRMARSAGR